MKYAAEVNSIGYFGDVRRAKAGKLLFDAIVSKGHLVINSLAKNRAEQVRFQRFLWNEEVTLQEMKAKAFERTAKLASEAQHILCLQDTTELDFGKREVDIEGLGDLMSRKVKGLYLHPVLAVDAEDGFVLGLCGFNNFDYSRNRAPRNNDKENRKPIEEKASYRWLECAEEAKSTLNKTKILTFVSDRESDIYEYLARVPDSRTKIIVRSRINRLVGPDGEEPVPMGSFVNSLPVRSSKEINVHERNSQKTVKRKILQFADQKQRIALVELRYQKTWIYIPQSPSIKKSETDSKKVEMTIVDVRESTTKNDGANEMIHWRILTTHQLETDAEAWQIVEWYKKRWDVEQLFRSAKKGGMRLEDIALSKGECIRKLAFLGLLASCRILQLSLSRSTVKSRPASTAFSDSEQIFLKALNQNLQGKTAKQKNPYPNSTMAWCYWIIGRLGGWNGYASEGPAGPVTLKRGLDQFENQYRGWKIAMKLNVCMT